MDNLLVLPTPLGRVLALDPATGAERWRFDATVKGHRYREDTSRRVAAWLDAAATGKLCPALGRGAEVSLKENVSEERARALHLVQGRLRDKEVLEAGSSALGRLIRIESVLSFFTMCWRGTSKLTTHSPLARFSKTLPQIRYESF